MPRKYLSKRKFNQVAPTRKDSDLANSNRLKREANRKNKKIETGEGKANGGVSRQPDESEGERGTKHP